MNKKKIIIVSILIILILIGTCCFLIYFSQIRHFYYDNFTCGQEGQIVGASGMPITCCRGLKSISGSYPSEDCNQISTGGLQICSNCGNKICESKTWENKCNCPEDCN